MADPMVISWPKGIEAQRRAAPPVPARHRHRPDDVRPARRRAARGRQGLSADPARGRELPLDVRERRRADAEGDRVLLDARLAGDLAQGLEGGQRPPDDRRLGPLRRGSLGALRHRERPDREPRPRRRAPGEGPGADQPLVPRGRPVQRPAAAGQDRGRGAGRPDPAAGGAAARPLRLLPGRRRGARVGGGQHPQPQLHASRSRSTSTPPTRAACCSPTARASAATRSTSRTASSSTSTTSSASTSRWSSRAKEIPTGKVDLSARRSCARARDADDRHAVAVHRRREGRRGPDHDPARQLLARRRGPQRRHAIRPSRSPTTTRGRRRTRSPGARSAEAIVDVSGEHFVDLEMEALAMHEARVRPGTATSAAASSRSRRRA